MGEQKQKMHCGEHGEHCKAIQYLENGINELKGRIKDERTATIHDNERLEDSIKKEYVQKVEFALTQKLIYGVVTLVVLDFIRGLLS